MDTKEVFKWGVFIIIGWLALRWLGNLAVTLSGGLSAGIPDGGWNAPYAAPLSAPYYVRPQSAWWNGLGAPYGTGRYGPGKRYGGPHDR
ncbi:MAG: hypothetical protein ACLQHT_13595 [Terracidiphilus sp.]